MDKYILDWQRLETQPLLLDHGPFGPLSLSPSSGEVFLSWGLNKYVQQ